jgi:hypothetical protein
MSRRIEIKEAPRGKWAVELFDDGREQTWEEFPPMTVHKVLVLLGQVLKDKRWP